MKKLMAHVVLLSGVLMVSAAQADDKPAQPPKIPTFSELDADKDGQISRKEAEADHMLSERFNKFDANGDGYLVWSEMPAPPSGDKKPKALASE